MTRAAMLNALAMLADHRTLPPRQVAPERLSPADLEAFEAGRRGGAAVAALLRRDRGADQTHWPSA